MQTSPGERHERVVSKTHFCCAHKSEQHSALAVQGSPFTWQIPPPHTPWKQPSEQQSYARVQAMPSAKQCSAHVLVSSPGASGSQRPLQQVLLFSHSVPSEWHRCGSMHVPATQKREQHSLARVHATPCTEQLALAPAAPTSAADASSPPPPAPPVSGETCATSSPTLRSDAHPTHALVAARANAIAASTRRAA